jgi:hypothetical protein
MDRAVRPAAVATTFTPFGRCALTRSVATLTGVQYEIVVRGLLSETLLAAFPTLRAEAQEAETVLAGTLADQAALYGVIAQIEALGLELIEVRRTHS